MMKINFAALLFAFLALVTSGADAQGEKGRVLAPVKDPLLIRIMNESEQVAAVNGRAYLSRIVTLRDRGECSSPAPACPKEQLFIAVSELDEEPAQQLYSSEKAHRWAFVEWKTIPERDGPGNFLVAAFRKENFSSRGEATSSLVLFRFNPYAAYMASQE